MSRDVLGWRAKHLMPHSSFPESQPPEPFGLQALSAHLITVIACGGPSDSRVASIKVRPCMPQSHCVHCIKGALHPPTPLCDSTKLGLESQSRLSFLSCCRQFWDIEVPIRLGSALFHPRYYPPPRFRILEAKLCGDAIDAPTLASVGTYAEGLVSLEMTLCRSLKDVSGVLACPYVSSIKFSECTKIKDLSPLAHCVCLENLSLVACFKALNLAPLQYCRRLQSVTIADNPYIQSMTGLFGCTTLRSVQISNCPGLDACELHTDLHSRFHDLKALTWNGKVILNPKDAQLALPVEPKCDTADVGEPIRNSSMALQTHLSLHRSRAFTNQTQTLPTNQPTTTRSRCSRTHRSRYEDVK